MKKVVSKFGGTSMGDAACMRRAAEISLIKNSFVVVVSATSGTTNQLILLGETAKQGKWSECESIVAAIRARHDKISSDIKENVNTSALAGLYEEMESIAKGIYLLKDCSPRVLDALVSVGERLSSVLFVAALEVVIKEKSVKASAQKENTIQKTAKWLDARDVIITDEMFGKARPINYSIKQKAVQLLNGEIENSIYVTQGFIGKTEDGITTTLGRGGSDYSAALFAEAIDAEILEIWTDVTGIATTDPRICPDAKSISEISFKEASELATFGAKVLHPATLAPAIRQNIPVFVGSSFDPETKGTWIFKEVASSPLVRAIAMRKKQVLVTLTTPEMLHSHGFLFSVFKVFNENQVSIDAITTSEISVSLTLDDSTLLNKKLIGELSKFADVVLEEKLALISVIGNNVNHTPGLAKKIFDLIPEINVRMICLGASRHNFCFLVADESGNEVVQRLHKGFGLNN